MLRLTFQPEAGEADAALDAAASGAADLLERVRLLETLVEQLEERLAQPPPPAAFPEVTIARHGDLHAAEAAGALRRVWVG